MKKIAYLLLFLISILFVQSCEDSPPVPKNQREIYITALTKTGGTQGWVAFNGSGEVLVFTIQGNNMYLIQNGVNIGTWDVSTDGSTLKVFCNGQAFQSIFAGNAGTALEIRIHSIKDGLMMLFASGATNGSRYDYK